MQTQKKDVLEILSQIDKHVAEVHHEIKRCMDEEGLDQQQIEIWINHLNKILHNVDHSVEILLESKN